MKYFMAIQPNSRRHILCAKDLAEAEEVLRKAGIKHLTLRELTPEWFNCAGFIISDPE